MPPTQLFLSFPVTTILERVARKCGLTSVRPRTPVAPIDPARTWKDGMKIKILRNPRARRYLLRLQSDGVARLVIPRRGSRREALAFLERNETWLRERFRHWQTRRAASQPWVDGRAFLFRGDMAVLRVTERGSEVELRFADQVIVITKGVDLRAALMKRLRALAEDELPRRTRELARAHGIGIQRVTIRAQKTRWGSCSARGTISLNWRLIQAPASVQDYLIIHELMHRRQMNHSARFWKLVAEACPGYRTAEEWLKRTRLAEME